MPSDAFLGLRRLTTINLRGNHLRQIDPNVFRDGMDKLINLILADNQLRFIPYQAVSPLKALRMLDLSYNLIKQVQPSSEIAGMELLSDKMHLEILRLDYNQIDILVSGSFQNFAVVNQTYLDGNILTSIEVGLFREVTVYVLIICVFQNSAFEHAKIRKLYMRHCGITKISPESFNGIEDTLVLLDLSANNLTLNNNEFPRLELLETLHLKDNPLLNFNVKTVLNGFEQTLRKLDLSEIRGLVSLQDLRR